MTVSAPAPVRMQSASIRPLPPGRDVDHRFGGLTQSEIAHVFHDADDFIRTLFAVSLGQRQPAAN